MAKRGYNNPAFAPTEQPTALDIAWAAGIFEGEGHYGKNHKVVILQKDPWILYRLRNLFGGTVGSRIAGCAKRPYFEWRVYGDRARSFTGTIYGYLSPRRQEMIDSRSNAGVCYR